MNIYVNCAWLPGLNQGGLAAATGIDQATVSRLETGKRLPTVTQLQVLAQVLQTSMDTLMNGYAEQSRTHRRADLTVVPICRSSRSCCVRAQCA